MSSYTYPNPLVALNVDKVRVGDIVEFDYNGGTHPGKRLVLVCEITENIFSGYDLSLVQDTVGKYSSMDIYRCFTKGVVKNLKLFSEGIFKETLYTGQVMIKHCKNLVPDEYYFDGNNKAVVVNPFVLVVCFKQSKKRYLLSFDENKKVVIEEV